MTSVIPFRYSVLRQHRKTTSVTINYCYSTYFHLYQQISVIKRLPRNQPYRNISFLRPRCLYVDKCGRDNYAKYMTSWKVKEDLERRRVTVPVEEHQYFIIKQFLKYRSKYFGPDMSKVRIIIRDSGSKHRSEESLHFVVEAPEGNIVQAEAKLKNVLQDIHKALIFQKVSLPENEYLPFISRTLLDKHLKNIEEKCEVLTKFVGIGKSNPTADSPHILIVSESETKVQEGVERVQSLIQEIESRLTVKRVSLPDSENQRFISRVLINKHRKNFEQNYNVLTAIVGTEKQDLTGDSPQVVIVSESEANVARGVENMKHLVQDIESRLTIKRVYLPDNEYQTFIVRILINRHLKEFEQNYNVVMAMFGTAGPNLSGDLPQVVVLSESEANVARGAEYIEKLIQKIHRELTSRELCHPESGYIYIINRILARRHLKEIEETFGVYVKIVYDGSICENNVPAHFLVVSESESNIQNAMENMKNVIQDIRKKYAFKSISVQNNENQEYIMKVLNKVYRKKIEENYNVLTNIFDHGMSSTTDALCSIDVGAENEDDAREAVQHINLLIEDLQKNLIVRDVFISTTKYPHAICRILAKTYLKKLAEEFEVSAWIKGEGKVDASDDAPRVVVVSTSAENVKKAAADMENLVKEIQNNIMTRKISLPVDDKVVNYFTRDDGKLISILEKHFGVGVEVEECSTDHYRRLEILVVSDSNIKNVNAVKKISQIIKNICLRN